MRKNTLFYILGILAFAGVKAPCQAQPISAEFNYARNSPGIVMVQAVFSATVYVNRMEINERLFDKLVDSVKRLDTTGTLMSPGQKLDIVVQALYKSPFRFFSASDEYFRQEHRVQTTGTGFLITDDGYLVTNCHIVDRDSAFIRNKFIQSTFRDVTDANINSLQLSWAMTLNDEQRSLLNDAYSLIYSQVSSMILFDLRKEFFALYRADSNQQTVTVKKPARVIIKGQPMPGKDVAILKIDNASNLPTLTLTPEPLSRIGTQVLVFGFPEPVTTNTFLAADAGMEPSLTAGVISAIKKSIGGWPVIQMDAVISHGSSGSPVCNDRGEVIGLATFGSLDQGRSALASGFNFAIPISVIRQFIDSVQLKPATGKASVYFDQGLEYFYQQFYRKAKERFEETRQLNPNFPQLSFYLAQCNSRIDGGADKQSPPRKYVFWIMLIIAVLTAGYLVIKWRREEFN